MSDRIRLLIVGGYGIFGGRIVELLETEPRLTVLVAGRSAEKAQAFCGSRETASAQLVATRFDRDGDLAAQLAALSPDIVIDASGPFQAYGEAPYRLVRACIEMGVNYLDLADGSEFVAGVKQFDDAALEAGVFVLSGVSSFPVLTAAVVRRLSAGMARVETIRGGIAPSPFAGVGENVIRAIASYAGQPIALRKDGADVTGHPFTEHLRYTIAPGGKVPLRSTLFSLVDVPDLQALTELWPEAKSIWMGAGPVPEVLHRALIAFAWLARWRILPTLSPLSPLMHFVTNTIRWGEHRGGMFVEVAGTDANGVEIARSWHLLAEGSDGPLIPSMAVQAIVRNCLYRRRPEPGARAAIRDLEVEDYEALFAGRTIHTGMRTDAPRQDRYVYAAILGDAWDRLPEPIRRLHALDGRLVAKGRARVERGVGLLSRLAGAMMRFPKAAADTPVQVQFELNGGVETWTRTFGDERFSSRQFAGTGRSERLLVEQFGPMKFAMALVADDERLRLVLRRWSFLGLKLPMWLCPRSDAFESVQDGRFHFDVEISHWLTGLIVRYRGWLEPEASQADRTTGSDADLPTSRQSLPAQSVHPPEVAPEAARTSVG